VEITHPTDLPRLEEEVEQFLNIGQDDFSQTYRLMTKSGEYRWIEDRNHLIRDDEGRATHIQGIIVDVSQWKQTEMALAESEENFAALLENADEAIFINQPGGEHFYANRYACQMTGYSREELLRMKESDILVSDEVSRVVSFSRNRLEGGEVPSPYETIVLTKDGREVPVEVTGAATTWKGKSSTIGMLRDISQRKDSELALRRSRLMLEQAQQMANIGSWVFYPEERSVVWSDQLFRLHGLDKDKFELTPEAIAGLMHPEDREHVSTTFLESALECEPFEAEYRVIRPDGEIREVLSRGRFFPAEPYDDERWVGTTMDVTEMRQLERRVVDIAREEQHRLGQDLHDTLGQELTGLAFLAKALERKLVQEGAGPVSDAHELSKRATSSVRQAKRIAHGLAPVDIAEEGLAHELKALASGTTELYGIACLCTVEEPALIRSNVVATHLYYMAREAVSNSVRHSKAKHIEVSLSVQSEEGVLEIRDDGIWSERERRSPGQGMGLRIMKSRAAIIGAKLNVFHDAGQGTIVKCIFNNSAAD